eukprot:scaffold8329_cov112-Isochrysis_galbana.AAC.5
MVVRQVQLEQLLERGHITGHFAQAVFTRVEALKHISRESGEPARAKLQHAVLAGCHQCRLDGAPTLLRLLLKERFVAALLEPPAATIRHRSLKSRCEHSHEEDINKNRLRGRTRRLREQGESVEDRFYGGKG